MTLSDQIISLASDSLVGSFKQIQFISKALCLEKAGEVGLGSQHQRWRSWPFTAGLHSSVSSFPVLDNFTCCWHCFLFMRKVPETVCPLVTCHTFNGPMRKFSVKNQLTNMYQGWAWGPGGPALSQAESRTSLWGWLTRCFVHACRAHDFSPHFQTDDFYMFHYSTHVSPKL